jgi:hypothetical protein
MIAAKSSCLVIESIDYLRLARSEPKLQFANFVAFEARAQLGSGFVFEEVCAHDQLACWHFP